MTTQAGQTSRTYEAPWGKPLYWISALLVVVCLTASAGVLCAANAHPQLGGLLLVGMSPLIILVGCALFTVRSYTITPQTIVVRRLLWDTALPRSGMEAAYVEPDVMRRSIRTFGNGGGFSFTGLYYNKRLRTYRAFVTDLSRTVVLRYAGRTVVLSPDSPEEFVRDLGVPALDQRTADE